MVGRKVLVRRNVARFCATGRYVNVNAINEAMIRTQDLLATATSVAAISNMTGRGDDSDGFPTKKNEPLNKGRTAVSTVRLHAALAKLGGFYMNPIDRTVSRIGKPHNIPISSINGKKNNANSNTRGQGLLARAPA